jgi:hypothetical protein
MELQQRFAQSGTVDVFKTVIGFHGSALPLSEHLPASLG